MLISDSAKVVIQCKQCGKEFADYAYFKRKYCSHKCYGESKKGKPWFNPSEELRKQRRRRMFGENNPMWCGGDSDKERRNSDYKLWRIAVFVRDDFTCQECGYRHGDSTKRKDLHAHHIVKWIDSIELRYVLENGKTLCIPCHIQEHTNID